MSEKKKVLLAILSSNVVLYKKNTEALKDVYRRMKDTFNLDAIDVDVISFTAGDKTELVEDTLYTACLDSNIYVKHRIFMEYLLQHPEYDIIINTNATTIINLSYVNAFIKENFLTENNFYGIYMMKQLITEHIFIPAMVIMSSGKDFREKLCNIQRYDEIYEKYKEEIIDIFGVPSENDTVWKGVPEDFIWGEMLYDYKGVQLNVFNDSMMLRPSIYSDSEDYLNRGIFKRNFAVNIKVEFPIEERIEIEPFLIYMAAQIMLQKPIETIGHFYYNYYII